jgi:hypothetical protein
LPTLPVVKLKACVGLFVDVLVVSVYRWVWAIIICKSVLDTRKSLEILKEEADSVSKTVNK